MLLLGSGERGKEVAIELQRLGCEVIACDPYANAPAMQVAHRSHGFPMLDGDALRRVLELEKPHLVVPTEGEFQDAVQALGMPCVLKPLMSSSGKGQSVVRAQQELEKAWAYAQEGGRSGAGRCIVEGFVPFDFEITCLTVSAVDGLQCCPPIGHVQIDGDYRESWQPMPMSDQAWATLGFPIPDIRLHRPSASVPLLGDGTGIPRFSGLEEALSIPESQVRLFGKPNCEGHRRLAVALASADTLEVARTRAKQVADAIRIELDA